MLVDRARRSALAFAVVLALLSAVLTYAQTNTESGNRNYLWIQSGFGVGSQLFAIGVSLSYQNGHHLMSLRSAITVDALPPWGAGHGDIGALYGYCSRQQQSTSYYAVAAGISYVTVDGKGETIGVPIAIQWFLMSQRSGRGIGIYGFANLNRYEPFCGVLLSLQADILN